LEVSKRTKMKVEEEEEEGRRRETRIF
jgi:hypothetical protein